MVKRVTPPERRQTIKQMKRDDTVPLDGKAPQESRFSPNEPKILDKTHDICDRLPPDTLALGAQCAWKKQHLAQNFAYSGEQPRD